MLISELNKEHWFVPAWFGPNRLVSAILDMAVMLAGATCVVVSLALHATDPENNWFSRSGALLVLSGAILEYRHANYARRISEISISWASGVGNPPILGLAMFRIAIKYVAHCYVVAGTLVWAYGDMWA